MSGGKNGVKVVARNRKARHKYNLEETCEAGIALKGSEVKSLRQGMCSIQEAYAGPRGDELFVFNMHIPPYEQATHDQPDPIRPRKLLLHRREIDQLISQCTQRGYTLVPLSVYFRRGHAKLELALAKGKDMSDKRHKKMEKQRQREIQQELQRRRKRHKR